MTPSPSYRFKLTIEYDGTLYVGWQVQDNGLAVQEVLQSALKGFCGEEITAHGSGRTDAGVHALKQVAHIDLPHDVAPHVVRNALNQHLKPAPVAITLVEPVSDEFDARFSATARHYTYHIVNRRVPLTLMRKRAWLVYQELDAALMQEEAQTLLGRHDFTTFRSVHCQAKSPLKTLDRLDVDRRGEEIFIHASARSFMHNQVRSLVGSLKLVGEGRWPVGQLRKALEAKDRKTCGPVAPAHGLYLARVDYDGGYARDQALPAK